MTIRQDEVSDRIVAILERRQRACERIDRALAHRTRLDVLAIVTSWMSVDEVEQLALFQEGRG